MIKTDLDIIEKFKINGYQLSINDITVTKEHDFIEGLEKISLSHFSDILFFLRGNKNPFTYIICNQRDNGKEYYSDKGFMFLCYGDNLDSSTFKGDFASLRLLFEKDINRKHRFESELAYYNDYANNKTLNIISNNAF